MTGPLAARLPGDRLHLQHGPIDVIIGAEAKDPGDREAAFEASILRFETLLAGLVVELPQHRQAIGPNTPLPKDPTARRMYRAARRFASGTFVTPMSAVAGAVAEELLAALTAAAPLRRAYVNNGGDIALHLGPGARFRLAMAGLDGQCFGHADVRADGEVRGVATSGCGGRSLSLGICDSVTVLARTASEADVAATLIANAVDLPGHPQVSRRPAQELSLDSDLGARMVVTGVGVLSAADRARALRAGWGLAERYRNAGLIQGASLHLQGQTLVCQSGDGDLTLQNKQAGRELSPQMPQTAGLAPMRKASLHA